MMSHTQFQQQATGFTRSVSAFEQCVDTPFVPGELGRWMDAVADAFGRLTEFLNRQRQDVHSDEFRDIAREDPGLLRRVELMREEDRGIAEGRIQLSRRIDDLKLRIAGVGADEAAMRPELNEFVEAAQRFVARVRKQEVTVRTWWMEAFMRDRGEAD